jgi:cytidylate kinase
MDADTDVLLGRRPEDFINRDYIVFQRNAYMTFAKALDAISLDTTSCSVEENFQNVTNHLEVHSSSAV